MRRDPGLHRQRHQPARSGADRVRDRPRHAAASPMTSAWWRPAPASSCWRSLITATAAALAGAGHRSARCARDERPARARSSRSCSASASTSTPRRRPGVIMTRMTSDIENLQQLLQDGLAQLVGQALTMVVITVILFTMNVELTLITLALVIPLLTLAHALVHARFAAWLRPRARRDRRRARRPLGEPARRAHGRRLQPSALERRPAPQRRRRLPRRQQLHGADQRDLRSRDADARLPRPGGAARDRRQHGAAPPALDRCSWSRSSCT